MPGFRASTFDTLFAALAVASCDGPGGESASTTTAAPPAARLGAMSATASRPKVRPLDPLDLDGLLSDEDRLIAETVRRFSADRILPSIEEWYEQGTLPSRELGPELGALGLLGMHLTGYGCAGASATSYGVACRELEAADSGLRSFVSVQGSLAMFPIWKFGSDEQKDRWLTGMAAGELIGCFGLTEPDSGSDPSSMKTNAKRDGSDWVLNGAKMWITNGGVADVAVVWARTDDGIRGFLVPRDTPGFTTQDIHRKHSLRASITSELVFDDVRLPEDAVLPGVTGMRGPLSCLGEARYGILWGVVGAARTCLDTALEYSKSRPQFGRPIAAFQLTQQKLVNMMLELQKAQLLALHVGRLKDEGRVAPEHISMGKLNNVREAIAIAREARTILGANGISSEYPVMRHAENLESVLTYEGTSEIHTLILGQALTGEAAFT
ncbi:MAG: glutaryl-CoA dehydrogenase [Solirubrobacteraceae bacterium]|nr:glutaryl-CoA dehydrogenase [Solirubrobacteraceae bacterium]